MADPGIIKGMAIGVASFGLVWPPTGVLAQSPPNAVHATRAGSGIEDVALTSGGTLSGRVVDATGSPLEGANVTLSHGNRLMAEVITDKSGSYTFRDLQSGAYQLTAASSRKSIRVWKANAAPPGAKSQALLVTGYNSARGQVGLIPANALLAGGTASAAAGAAALSGNSNSTPLVRSNSSRPAASQNPGPSQNSAFTENGPNSNSPAAQNAPSDQNSTSGSAAPQGFAPEIPVPDRLPDGSIRQDLLVKDGAPHKYVVCPTPHSP